MTLTFLVSIWPLIILAAFTPGVRPQTDAELPGASPVRRPALQPAEAAPLTGAYMLKSSEGKVCIRASMGVEYIITEKQKSWYYDLEPSMVTVTGHCDVRAAVLSLALPDDGANLSFTFRKEANSVYVAKINAHLSPLPVCQKCPNETYLGLLDNQQLFKTKIGESFTCQLENVLLMSPQLKIKLVPLQIQAFSLLGGQFGKEVECWSDYNKRVIPIVIGATLVGLILISVLTFQFIKDRRRSGYERIIT